MTATGLLARHGFFTRRGGVSEGAYASLNCSVSSADSLEKVRQNRALVAEAMDIAVENLVGVKQVHGCRVQLVEWPWTFGQGPEADAMVTGTAGVALGIVTADCAPVLFSDEQAGIVGAAHAGWRGACSGVLEAVVDSMLEHGARRERLVAAIGPCIRQESYEVAADLRDEVLSSLSGAGRFFVAGRRPERWQFDLPGYCSARLAACRISVEAVALDTYADEARFFSHRRRVLSGGGPIGHQISVIVA